MYVNEIPKKSKIDIKHYNEIDLALKPWLTHIEKKYVYVMYTLIIHVLL